MEFLGIYSENDMPPFFVPSKTVQTLLTRSIFQRAELQPYTIASVALASKSIQNSSLGANVASTFKINRASIPLFVQSGVLHPSSCFSVQLSPEFDFEGPQNRYDGQPSPTKEEDDADFIQLFRALNKSNYFKKSVQRITIWYFTENLVTALFFPPSREGCQEEEENNPFPQLQYFSASSLAISDALFLRLASTALKNISEFVSSGGLGGSPTLVSASAIVKAVISFPNLRAFTWNFQEDATDDDLRQMVGKHPNLHTLALNGCDDLSSGVIAELVSSGNLSNVTDLSLAGNQADDNLLAVLAASYQNAAVCMSKLQLCACRKLTDDGIKAFCEHTNTTITHLNLQYADKLSLGCLRYIGTTMPRLRKFEFYGKENTQGREEVIEFKNMLPNCEFLVDENENGDDE